MIGLADSLVRSGVVRAEDMRDVVARFGDGPGLRQKLVDAQIATDGQIAEALAAGSGLPFVDLTSMTIPGETIATVPAALCRRYL